MRSFWAVSRVAFYGLVVMLVIAIATAFISYPRNPKLRPAVGCYWTDALVAGVECQGFTGSDLAGKILTMPVTVFVYTPIFLFGELKTGLIFELARKHPVGLIGQIGFLAWLVLGLLYPLRLAYVKRSARPSTTRPSPK